MKILYLSASTLPSYEANSVNVINMSSSFVKNGHTVTLIGNKGMEDDNKGLDKFYDIDNSENIKKILVPRNRWSFFNRILKALPSAFKSDLVYTRWISGAFIFSVILRRKSILEIHTLSSNKLKGDILLKLIVKYSKVQKYIFITKSLENKYIEKFGGKIKGKTMVLSGASTFKTTSDDFIENKKEISCGYVGSFKEGKGVDTIVKLAAKLPEIQFHIIGGSEKEINEYKEKIGDYRNIVWYGNLPYSVAKEKTEEFNIALLPNKETVMIKNENIGDVTSPNKLFEYMAAGKAIIASDVSVLKEILVDNYNCILVNAENIEEWKNAVLKLKSNEKLKSELQKNALNEIHQKYNWINRANKSLEGVTVEK